MADQSTAQVGGEAVADPKGEAVDPSQLTDWSFQDYPMSLRISEKLRRFIDRVGRLGSWFIVPLVLITTLDIIARKLIWRNAEGEAVGLQIWLVSTFGRIFESTLLQELEWHLHTALWVSVLGYGYIWNTHVRVDLVREHLKFRRQAWIEFLGVTFFLIPYTCIVMWFASEYAYDSWEINEISASQVGLPMRWIIKTVIVLGMGVAVIAGISVWLQLAMVLFGPKNVRYPLMTLEWPEERGGQIEGKERLDLDRAEGVLEQKAREWEAKKAAAKGEA